MEIVMNVLAAVFWGLLLLSVLVVFHEAGHFLVARAFGVRVTEFYLGLPCPLRVFRKSRKTGTEFGVSALLLGGYNRICGMEGTADELLADAFAIVQREGRVKATQVAEELDIELGHAYDLLATLSDYAAIKPYFDPELGEHRDQRDFPEAFETLARDANMATEYDKGHDFTLPGSTSDAEPRPLADAAAQLVQEESHTYVGKSYLQRLAILVAGPLVNIVLSVVLVASSFMLTEYQLVHEENVIGSVVEASLAEQAGLREGDRIVAVGNEQVGDWPSVSTALKQARESGSDFTITYERDGKEATAHIDLPEGQAPDLIGVSPVIEPYRLTLPEAFDGAMRYMGMVGSRVVSLLVPTQTMQVLDQSTSVVGISVMAAEAASAGFMDLINLMAAISMSLGFMNLLPIPPLDGGKIVLETIQAVLRRRLSKRFELAFNYVGIAFFVFIFVVVMRNDIARLIVG